MITQLLNGGYTGKEIVLYLLIYFFAITISFSFHEFMHAAVAVWLGDETPRNMGRLTLNPLAHMDPIGTILILVAGIGWGKPVTYNPNRLGRFKSLRLMNIMVSLAGVFGNFILALISTIIVSLLTGIFGITAITENVAISTIYSVFLYTTEFSLMLLAFNLIPIPPLDGFRVLEELLPYKLRYSEGYRKFQKYSPYGIWILFIIGMVTRVSVIGIIVNIIEIPFRVVLLLVGNLIISLF